MARVATATGSPLDAEGIYAREEEYRRRAHALLRGEYRSYFRGAGLGEADREPIVCEVVDDVLLGEASGRVRAGGRSGASAASAARRPRAGWTRSARSSARIWPSGGSPAPRRPGASNARRGGGGARRAGRAPAKLGAARARQGARPALRADRRL